MQVTQSAYFRINVNSLGGNRYLSTETKINYILLIYTSIMQIHDFDIASWPRVSNLAKHIQTKNPAKGFV